MTNPTPDRPSLWRVMRAAFSNRWLDVEPTGTDNAAGLAYAAEIRALRDWLMPEEPEPEPGDRYEQRHIIWRHNQRLRALLGAQADRAERGDG